MHMHALLPYVPFGLLIIAIIGGFYEVAKSIAKWGTKIVNAQNENKTMLLVLNTRLDDHLKQHSGKW